MNPRLVEGDEVRSTWRVSHIAWTSKSVTTIACRVAAGPSISQEMISAGRKWVQTPVWLVVLE